MAGAGALATQVASKARRTSASRFVLPTSHRGLVAAVGELETIAATRADEVQELQVEACDLRQRCSEVETIASSLEADCVLIEGMVTQRCGEAATLWRVHQAPLQQLEAEMRMAKTTSSELTRAVSGEEAANKDTFQQCEELLQSSRNLRINLHDMQYRHENEELHFGQALRRVQSLSKCWEESECCFRAAKEGAAEIRQAHVDLETSAARKSTALKSAWKQLSSLNINATSTSEMQRDMRTDALLVENEALRHELLRVEMALEASTQECATFRDHAFRFESGIATRVGGDVAAALRGLSQRCDLHMENLATAASYGASALIPSPSTSPFKGMAVPPLAPQLSASRPLAIRTGVTPSWTAFEPLQGRVGLGH